MSTIRQSHTKMPYDYLSQSASFISSHHEYVFKEGPPETFGWQAIDAPTRRSGAVYEHPDGTHYQFSSGSFPWVVQCDCVTTGKREYITD